MRHAASVRPLPSPDELRAFELETFAPGGGPWLEGEARAAPVGGHRKKPSELRPDLPWLDDLVDGSSATSVARFMLTLDREAPRAAIVWKEKSHAADY